MMPPALAACFLCMAAALAAVPMARALTGPARPDAGLVPDLGPNVLVFDPSMTDIQARIDAVFAEQERAQFGSGRYALLFKPGKYYVDVRVGFYTQVAGLGRSPDDVSIVGAVRSNAGWMRNNNATCNFWRCVENLSITPAVKGEANIWAVSQATALRRVHVRGDLILSDGGWSSGGLIADSIIDGRVDSGTQQQWLSRNVEWGEWRGGNWNMVFVGTTNPPAGSWPEKPYTVIEKTPIIREKPYLCIDDTGRYAVMVPDLDTGGTRGATWRSGSAPAKALSIDEFYIAHPKSDDAATINAALDAGKNLLFTPGLYHLDSSLRVSRPGAVVLGLGYPTLIAADGTAAMTLADVDGLTISGLIFEAGATESPTLLHVGEPGSSASHAASPAVLHDLCCRAGGTGAGSADSFVTIHSSNVIGDNLWLWRADHGAGVGWESNRNRNGLIVNGADVTIYGLFVEHCREYQTIWNGERGRVYFYQSEMPYDPPSERAWSHDGVRGFASYKVADTVTTHEAWGLGVYCVFRSAPVIADTAIEAPVAPGVKLHHMIAVRLNGLPGSGINHVLNNEGAPVISTKTSRLDSSGALEQR